MFARIHAYFSEIPKTHLQNTFSKVAAQVLVWEVKNWDDSTRTLPLKNKFTTP